MRHTSLTFFLLLSSLTVLGGTSDNVQTLTLRNASVGKSFDGIGAVNGGGATAVLLKDYPEPWRSQIMDMVFKPQFGASVSTLLAEIPGDGNSTQGSMPAHSHYRGDYNPRRGYMWWVLREAQQRNPNLTLDATAWSAPGWVENYWSDDMVDFYISWLEALRTVHGLELDAIGCHNEKGCDYRFAKALRRAMDEQGFASVRLHAFDNWGDWKMDFVNDMQQDAELAEAIDIVSAHTFSEIPLKPEQRAAVERLEKPIWNSEDHIYRKGFDCLISIVKCFNENYIVSGATKVVNWYDIGGVYPLEPYSYDPPMLIACEPWSGHYEVRENLWAYAHYGQFTRVGWRYIDEGCRMLDGGGSVVTLTDPESGDYTIIVETKEATEAQTLKVVLPRGLSRKTLCQWRSCEGELFVQQKEVKPSGRTVTLHVEPGSVYSFSTTRGQQKGMFADIPASAPFPLPYREDFDSYTHPEQYGYLPHYTADLIGSFELTERPDHKGQCLQQMVGEHTHSWAPEWHYYTILGDSAWTDYQVSADVWLHPGDEAGVMGRLCDVGSGYGIWAKGYYLKMNSQGRVELVISRGKLDKRELIGDAEQQALIRARNDAEQGGELLLDSCLLTDIYSSEWHRLALRFEGDVVTGYVDGNQVVKATSDKYGKGMAGLLAPLTKRGISTPCFDNLEIIPVGQSVARGPQQLPAVNPLYP